MMIDFNRKARGFVRGPCCFCLQHQTRRSRRRVGGETQSSGTRSARPGFRDAALGAGGGTSVAGEVVTAALAAVLAAWPHEEPRHVPGDDHQRGEDQRVYHEASADDTGAPIGLFISRAWRARSLGSCKAHARRGEVSSASRRKCAAKAVPRTEAHAWRAHGRARRGENQPKVNITMRTAMRIPPILPNRR